MDNRTKVALEEKLGRLREALANNLEPRPINGGSLNQGCVSQYPVAAPASFRTWLHTQRCAPETIEDQTLAYITSLQIMVAEIKMHIKLLEK